MSSTSHQPDLKDVLHEVPLGAATGDDAHLNDRLGAIARAVNEDTLPTCAKHSAYDSSICSATRSRSCPRLQHGPPRRSGKG